ncbi:hypothetical protein [Streptomyces bacillaris]|uniref:hypothetical protein n=1 Tax=Streptomyces bacillaris TaxID=68179 RepID=UPI0034610FF2
MNSTKQIEDGQIEGAAVIGAYFEDRITRAERGVEEARAALAQAEARVERRRAERDAFEADGALHPSSYEQEPVEAELCQWARTRIVCAALDGGPAESAASDRMRAEERALHQWLVAHGRSVPARFRD